MTKRLLWAILGVLFLVLCSRVSAYTNYYEWVGPALDGVAYGTNRMYSGDADGDRLSNVEEYGFGIAADEMTVSPVSINSSSGTMHFAFPVIRCASDLDWDVYYENDLTNGGMAWLLVTNATVSEVTSGAVDNITVSLAATNYDDQVFLRLQLALAQPQLINDMLDPNYGWTMLNNATAVPSSGGLDPLHGTVFFRHSVASTWSHSAMIKETGITIQEGIYLLFFNVGHDGTARPFATGNVTVGLFDITNSISAGADVRDAIDALGGFAGVTNAIVYNRTPNDGWETWCIEYGIAAGSDAIGRTVSFGIHVQSDEGGENQAMFDGLIITGPSKTPPYDETVVVDAGTVLNSDIPKTVFIGMHVHHKSAICKLFYDCSSVSNHPQRQGVLSNAFANVGLGGVRFPGGTFAETDYDFYDQPGSNYLASLGCTNGHGNFDTIPELLQWCKDCSLKPYLILPTKRYWKGYDTNTTYRFNDASNYAYNVVSMVKSNEQDIGSPNVEYWDIGNEVYEPSHESTNYAKFAGPIAMAIKEADSRAKAVVNVQPFNYESASNIVNILKTNSDWWNSVDGWTTHFLNSGIGNWSTSELYDMINKMNAIFAPKEPLITAISPSSWNGIRGANGFLCTYEQCLRAGVEHIVSWPVAHHNATCRFYVLDEGLTPAGVGMNWLVRAAVSNDMVYMSHTNGNPIKAMGFREGDEKLTVFLMGKNAGKRDIRLEINGFASSYVVESRLSAYAGDVVHDGIAQEFVPGGNQPRYYYYTTINGTTDYEIVKLEFTPAEPVCIRDALDADGGWILYNSAVFTNLSDGLEPSAGTNFFRHHVHNAWSKSAVSKATDITIEGGEYVINFDIGQIDIGVKYPWEWMMEVGLYASTSSISDAVSVRDAIRDFASLPGVKRIVSEPRSSEGWVTRRYMYQISAGSSAIGDPVSMGLYVQSGGSADATNTINFDNIVITGPAGQ